MKNYTRFAFSNKTKPKVFRYIIHRAADDKAYICAGTSEGFNRPLHTPLSLTQEDLAFKLPAYDYPKEVGYVSPGVIQILTDMEENDDKFFISKNLVTVTCKAKLVYSSSATNWLNDMYRIRLHYSDEHEVHDNVENCVYCEKEIWSQLIFLHDTLRHYMLQHIPGDFLKIVEKGEYLEREIRKHKILFACTEDTLKLF